MRFVDSPYPPGSIIAAQDHMGRFPEFEECLERVKVPVGTVLLRPRSGSCAFNCNLGLRHRQGAWVWFIDDDQVFEPDIILRLLKHEKDLVAPIVPMRYPPFDLVLYKQLEFYEGPDGRPRFRSDFYRIDEIGKHTGLLQVAGLPKAGLLAKERVWKTIPAPWFKVGRISPDEIDDDRLFMWDARQAGFELWADLDQDMPHIRSIALKADRDKDGRLVLRGIMGAENVGIVRGAA